MIEKKHKTLASVYLVNDAVASNLAMLSAWFLRFQFELIPVTKGQQEFATYAKLLPLVTIVFPLAFAVQGLYRIRPTRGKAEEWVGVAIGSIVGTVVLSGVLLWIRPDSTAVYSRATLALFLVLAMIFTAIGRTLVRVVVERRHREGKDLDRVLIAGNGDLARAVLERVASHRERLGFRIVGYLANGDGNGDDSDLAGVPRLGRIENAEEVVAEHAIDHVFVAMPHASSQAMMALLDRLMRSCVSIHVVPDLLQFMALRSRVEDLDGLPTINLSETPLEGWSRFVKRAFDLVVAAAALLLFSPVMLAVALAIWIEDGLPVFYRQTRMGLDGKPFEILKFRSMRVGAEQQTGAVWAEKDDPRRTAVGRVIRAWSLDELPQLWNVLVGDMSVIGPRPERPEFVQQFRAEFPHYMLRHKVRAGMTGWAQVHGWRGNTSIRMRIEHDLYYIENWSLLLDVKILFMTVLHGLRHENAY
ncbi:MAG: undecaprenyl-phosphate glucose phosphotransferase [Acidobacteria bacterium]|nr:undecaprenyl-phosphate glucose phosphotransferase [Acidobacteriota bacterium]MBV9476661.1 undecaprenyl-phosphate glucose phosphotransferase [Acidobacteriota bacterium]